jgi:enoyl-CoA hydratase/carnithine racemase
MSQELRIEVRDQIAWITIDRPDVRNALSADLCSQTAQQFRQLAAERTIRVFVLRGGGNRVFISGADIREFREKLATPEGALAYDEAAEELQSAIRRVPQPVIAMIQGHAIGSGCIVAVACDFRIASQAAKFGVPVAKFGFLSPLPDTLRLVDLVGPAQAKLLLMTARIVSADEALRIGLVDQVEEPPNLLAATETFARELIRNSPLSQKATKQMIAQFMPNLRVRDAADWYAEIFRSHDFREGLDAYFAKREPSFRGE